jgi:hypothetical protein
MPRFTFRDEYDVNFVYGADASNMDIAKRHIEPLVRKALEGYNVCVFAFGATGVGQLSFLTMKSYFMKL